MKISSIQNVSANNQLNFRTQNEATKKKYNWKNIGADAMAAGIVIDIFGEVLPRAERKRFFIAEALMLVGGAIYLYETLFKKETKTEV
ncbi:MAG: hypothetical protein E7Z92_00410 [Cyanobacteria bacterium SIG31]|nr:hypothetical protein [Cyanobacteria bacterium SIG31]